MKNRWWKHPCMIWPYGIFGGIGGIILITIVGTVTEGWALQSPSVADGLQSANSGVSGMFLGGIIAGYNVMLGGTTGCLFIHAFGKHRFTAYWLVAPLGSIFALLSAYQGISFASGYGREAALALFGIYFIWSISLIILGIYLVAKRVGSGSSDIR